MPLPALSARLEDLAGPLQGGDRRREAGRGQAKDDDLLDLLARDPLVERLADMRADRTLGLSANRDAELDQTAGALFQRARLVERARQGIVGPGDLGEVRAKLFVDLR